MARWAGGAGRIQQQHCCSRFSTRATCRQAELARRVGIGTKALRARLDELTRLGVPLEREEDDNDVFWSVPKGWFPGAVTLPAPLVRDLVRLLARMPRGAVVNRVLQHVLTAAPRDVGVDTRAVVATRGVVGDERHLAVLEDAAAERTAVEIEHFTASRGDSGLRHVSVQRVHIGPPARFVAVCHRTGGLRWFRVDGVMRARLDAGTAFRVVARAALERFEGESVDGFHEGVDPVRCAFIVRDPEARWVVRNFVGGYAM